MNHPQQQQHLQPPSNSNIPIEDEEGYQTPTSMPSSSQRSYNSSSNRPNSNRSLSSAASSVLQNNASFFVSHNTTMSRQRDVVNNGGAMIIAGLHDWFSLPTSGGWSVYEALCNGDSAVYKVPGQRWYRH